MHLLFLRNDWTQKRSCLYLGDLQHLVSDSFVFNTLHCTQHTFTFTREKYWVGGRRSFCNLYKQRLKLLKVSIVIDKELSQFYRKVSGVALRDTWRWLNISLCVLCGLDFKQHCQHTKHYRVIVVQSYATFSEWSKPSESQTDPVSSEIGPYFWVGVHLAKESCWFTTETFIRETNLSIERLLCIVYK